MRTITYTIMAVLGLIIGVGITYAIIQLINDLLYQIFIYPERTFIISLVLLTVYSFILYRRSKYKA